MGKSWSEMSEGEHAGIIIGAIIIGCALVGVCIWRIVVAVQNGDDKHPIYADGPHQPKSKNQIRSNGVRYTLAKKGNPPRNNWKRFYKWWHKPEVCESQGSTCTWGHVCTTDRGCQSIVEYPPYPTMDTPGDIYYCADAHKLCSKSMPVCSMFGCKAFQLPAGARFKKHGKLNKKDILDKMRQAMAAEYQTQVEWERAKQIYWSPPDASYVG